MDVIDSGPDDWLLCGFARFGHGFFRLVDEADGHADVVKPFLLFQRPGGRVLAEFRFGHRHHISSLKYPSP
jgi:hypothetical protein